MIKILSAGFVGLCLACFVLTGCGEKSPSDKKKEEVVRQKIPEKQAEPESNGPEDAAKSAEADSATAKSAEQTADADDQESAKAENKAADKEKSDGEEASAKTADSEGDQKEEQVLTETTAKQAEAEEKATLPAQPQQEEGEEKPEESLDVEMDKIEAEASALAEAGAADSQQPDPVIDLEEGESPEKVGEEAPEEDSFYNPFKPLFDKEKSEDIDMGGGKAREKRKILTPLEKIDLGQLQLEGVIMARSGNRAIVTDSSGKGYVVKKGTYIGLNSGVVESVESDRIIVAEELGGVTNRTELKLQKPAGE